MTNEKFRMEIEDVFYIKGRGVIAIGEYPRTRYPQPQVREYVDIIGKNTHITTFIAGIECSYKLLSPPLPGDKLMLLLSNVEKKDIERGMVIQSIGEKEE